MATSSKKPNLMYCTQLLYSILSTCRTPHSLCARMTAESQRAMLQLPSLP